MDCGGARRTVVHPVGETNGKQGERQEGLCRHSLRDGHDTKRARIARAGTSLRRGRRAVASLLGVGHPRVPRSPRAVAQRASRGWRWRTQLAREPVPPRARPRDSSCLRIPDPPPGVRRSRSKRARAARGPRGGPNAERTGRQAPWRGLEDSAGDRALTSPSYYDKNPPCGDERSSPTVRARPAHFSSLYQVYLRTASARAGVPARAHPLSRRDDVTRRRLGARSPRAQAWASA